MSAARLVSVDAARHELSAGPMSATIRGRSWHGVWIDEVSSYTPIGMVAVPRDHHLLSINFGDTGYVRSQRCGEVYEGAGLTGEAAIQPAGAESRWDGVIPPHMTVRFSPTAMIEMADAIRRGGFAQAEIANHFRIRDPFISEMAGIFRRELARPPHPAQDVLVESLTVALLMHLLRGYAVRPGEDEVVPRWIGPAALRRALAYIEDQPHAHISLDELAAVAGLSRFHFSRLFRKHVGLSPAAYVERSRLERAKTMIRLGHLPLAEIAYALGFADQSHFTRRFRRHVGCTPAAYAREMGRG